MIGFLIITFLVTIVMLNVLISIVADGYELALTRKEQLGRAQRAKVIVDLERTYLRPFSLAVTRRGLPCRLLHYPSWLLFLSYAARQRDQRGGLDIRIGWPPTAETNEWEGATHELQKLIRAEAELTREKTLAAVERIVELWQPA